MAADPFDGLNRVFLRFTNNNGEIYRLDRNISNTWTKVLDRDAALLIPGVSGAAESLVDSETLPFVICDPANQDHVYTALTYNNWAAGWQGKSGGVIIRSTDGGDTWEWFANLPVFNRQCKYIDVYDGKLAIGLCTSILFGSGRMCAAGVGLNINDLTPSLGLSQWWPTAKIRRIDVGGLRYAYCNDRDGNLHRYNITTDTEANLIGGAIYNGIWGAVSGNLSAMWIDPEDEDHQIVIGSDGTKYITYDDWSVSSPDDPITHGIDALDASNLVMSQDQFFYMRGRRVWALEDELSVSPVNMSGNLPGSGLDMYNGLYVEADAPLGGAFLYAVEVGDTWTDEGLGVALAGDRSARKAWEYPVLHTNDTDRAEQAIHHTLGDGSTQAAPGDHTHDGLSGLTGIEIEAADDLDAGDLVDIYDDSGALVRKADSNLRYPADGFVLAAVIAGNNATVYTIGAVTGLSGLTPGAKIYLDTAGGVSETAPTTFNYIVQEVGVAVGTTSMKFEPQLTILLA